MKLFYLSIGLASIFCLVILFTLNKYGISWDEPIYFVRGDGYVTWLMQPTFKTIDKYWSSNYGHPPLRQLITGLTREILSSRLKLLDVTRGYRFSTLLFVFLGVFTITYYAGRRYNLLTGLFCGIGLLLTPQVFYLANLATTDLAITVMWLICILSVVSLKLSPRQAVISGLLIGITLLTKFNGVFTIIPVTGYMFFSLVRKRNWSRAVILSSVVVLIAFGMFFTIWPWFWTNPIAHIIHFFRLELEHVGPSVWFMGRLYESAPWQYPFVMFLISTPLIILIPFFAGLIATVQTGTKEERFLAINALYPFLLLITIGAKRYDGIRQILPAYPFVVLIAAIGLNWFIRFMKKFQKTTILTMTLLVIVSFYQGIIRIHPYQQAYYNELVGGIKGAKSLGFESDYWGSPYLGILPWMNQHKNKQFCVTPTTNPFYYYLAMGYLEPGVVFDAAPQACDYLIVLMRQGYIYQYPNVVKLITQQRYEYAVSIDSVPLVAAYAIPPGAMDLFSRGKLE
jgi:4-amino-4-deoxy-L-arabinose transferase-like glycosyltransferase